ncbi:MAG: hypothetical protein KGV51_05890 [Moraxellaceae bacterium]|nr:hypothetical protein [Moraxellaceae bacterium]
MNNPKTRQQWIYDLLAKQPTLSYAPVFANYKKKWAKSKTTFDKDWKKAQERFKDFQQKINDEKLKQQIKLEKQAVKRDILDKFEAMELLTQIARGVVTEIEDKTTIPTTADRMKAISELAKFEGWYEPQTAISINGEDTRPVINLTLTN